MFLKISNFHLSKIILLSLSVLFLTACGFHLKQDNGISDKYPSIYVKSFDPTSELTRFINTRLRGAGVHLATSPSQNVAILNIISENRSSRTISFYTNAVKAEQELGYSMEYSLDVPKLEKKYFSVNLYRDFIDIPSQALAKSRESEMLTSELRKIAAEHVITTLTTLKE